MKLLIVTAVEQFEKEVPKLFRKANIETFSESDISGFKNPSTKIRTFSWFPSDTGGVESSLFFSFTEASNIELLFKLITEFNQHMETNNPIKAIVVPIEKFI